MEKGENLRGKRPEGAGRKPGVPNRAAQERIKYARERGPLPYEVLIHRMNYALKEHQDELALGDRADKNIARQRIDEAADYAAKAAPYVHAKVKQLTIEESRRWREADEKERHGIQPEQEPIDITDYKDLGIAEIRRIARQKLAE